MKAPLHIGALCVLASTGGCGETPQTVSNMTQNSIPAAAPDERTAWGRAFSRPDLLVDQANALGFGNSAFHSFSDPPPNFISTGTLVDLSSGPLPNNAGVYIYGAQGGLADELRIKFNINEPSSATSSKARFAESVEQYLRAIGVPGIAEVRQALANGRGGHFRLDGAELEVRRTEMRAEGAHSLNFIFHRPGVELQPD